MYQLKNYLTGFLVCTVCLLSTPGLSAPIHTMDDQIRIKPINLLQLARQGECSRRVGPYATQSTAWQRWREANNQGYSVSNGVVPCYDGYGTRGYCFFVFMPC